MSIYKIGTHYINIHIIRINNNYVYIVYYCLVSIASLVIIQYNIVYNIVNIQFYVVIEGKILNIYSNQY